MTDDETTRESDAIEVEPEPAQHGVELDPEPDAGHADGEE